MATGVLLPTIISGFHRGGFSVPIPLLYRWLEVTGLPMTYRLNDKQYIVVVVGEFNHPAELVALTLPEY